MGQILYHGNRKKEKGLSLIEVVISLAVIVIVSIAMVSIAIYSSNAQQKVNEGRFFRQHIDNSLHLYQQYSESDFNNAFYMVNNETIEYNVDKTFYFNDEYEFTSSSSAKYDVTYVFNSETNTLAISARYYGGDVIVERSTSK